MAGKPRILVADDELHIRRILQFLLEQEGFEVFLAEDGQEAWEAVPRFKPHLALLDVMMPRMDGFAVLDKIREGYATSRLPVIMLTAKGEDADRVRGLRGGANDYVVKPFNHDELLLRVGNLLESKRDDREANPLTGLPGNRAIDRESQARISRADAFGFMYVDIDRFKSFNDFYGYSRGDRAISFLADILRRSSREKGSQNDFIGHVGGDDFVVVTSADRAEELARHIVESFDAGIVELHDAVDYEKGFLQVESRTGKLQKFPLISLTVAIVSNGDGRFKHPAQLSDTLAELKRFGKTMDHSVIVRERRTGRDAAGDPELLVLSDASATDND